MKKLILVTIIGMGIYYTYQNRDTLQIKWTKIVRAANEPDAPATPIPETPAPIVESSTIPYQFVPKEGVNTSHWYYLLVRKSVETPDGVVGILPGSLIYYVSPGQFRTRAGQMIEVAANQVTQDVNVARRYANIDIAGQSAVLQQLKKEEEKFKGAK